MVKRGCNVTKSILNKKESNYFFRKKTLFLYFKNVKMKAQISFLFIIITMLFQPFLYGQNKRVIEIAIPSVMITYGLISLGDNVIRETDFQIRQSLEQNNAFWETRVDDYIQFAPAFAAYTMKLCHVESTHQLLDMTVIYGLSNLFAGSIVYGTKIIAGRERPNHSDYLSFPSGHTETAFVAAEFLHQEYGNKSVWISIGGYSAATFVGIARVYKNRHWVSDVVAGAGIGILSTKVVYRVYPHFRKLFGERDRAVHAVILPGYNHGNMSLYISCTF